MKASSTLTITFEDAILSPMNLFEKPVMLVDATGLIFRAYFSIPPTLSAPDGTVTNAVHGVLGSIIKLEEEVSPTASAMIFDAGRRTFRTEIFPAYKAQRPEPPDDLRPQFALTIEMARALGVPTLVEEGVEADDLIASCAMAAARRGHPVTVLTSDRDLLQILDTDGISVWFPVKGGKNREFEKWDRHRFLAEYGFPPERLTDYKALRGDPSDNIPGVAGIGEKTGMGLMHEFGSLEGIYESLGEIKQPKIRDKLTAERDNVFLYRRLVTLRRDVECAEEIDWDGFHPLNRSSAEFRAFAERLGLKRYILG